MGFQESLTLLTLVMSLVALTMATLALMPQIKDGLVILRESVLWGVLLAIIVAVGFMGWNRFREARLRRSRTTDVSVEQTRGGAVNGEPGSTFVSGTYGFQRER
jgi:hypothetical protein